MHSQTLLEHCIIFLQRMQSRGFWEACRRASTRQSPHPAIWMALQLEIPHHHNKYVNYTCQMHLQLWVCDDEGQSMTVCEEGVF